MKKYILYILFSLPVFARAQKLKVVTDPVSNHGLLIHDDQHKNVSWSEATAIAGSVSSWRLPTIEELKVIYTKTYDKQLLRSAVAPGTYYTSNYQAGSIGDTVHILGLMTGREFKVIVPQSQFNHLLLVKEY